MEKMLSSKWEKNKMVRLKNKTYIVYIFFGARNLLNFTLNFN